jgi:hypothetical protein
MSGLALLTLLTQVVAPITLLAWVAARPESTRTGYVLGLLAAAGYIVAVGLAGIWLVPPWYTPFVYGILLLGIAFVRVPRDNADGLRRPGAPARWITNSLHAALIAVSAAVAVSALRGRRVPDEPVDLAFPLKSGTYLVANGGSSELINAHLATLTSHRFRRYRGQSHGIDLVRLGEWGLRATGLVPRDPAAYRIFGDTVYAPCGGRVLTAVDGFEDMRPPEVDRAHMSGNHVVLECGDVWVLLAHLRRNSVRVEPQDSVIMGQPVGCVGNSGNSDEPHLHLHAQRPGTARAPFASDPVPVVFGGRYYARNARVVSR